MSLLGYLIDTVAQKIFLPEEKILKILLCAELQVAPTGLPSSDHAVIELNDCSNSGGPMGPIAFQAPSGISSA